MFLEYEASRVAASLNSAGIDYILLKGASFNQWLNPAGTRWYVDVDLLVAPHHMGAVGPVLARVGYQTTWQHGQAPEHSWTRVDPRTGIHHEIDLHRSLPGLSVRAEAVWAELADRRETIVVHGVPVPALDLAARCYHVAHHAAQHGEGHMRTADDLHRALERTSAPDWLAAADLARRFGSLDLMVAGLRRVPAGAAMAAELNLTQVRGRPRSIGHRCVTSGNRAAALQELRADRSWRGRARRVRDVLVPPPVALREHSGLARRGRIGLCVAYLGRWIRIALALPTAERQRRSAASAVRD